MVPKPDHTPTSKMVEQCCTATTRGKKCRGAPSHNPRNKPPTSINAIQQHTNQINSPQHNAKQNRTLKNENMKSQPDRTHRSICEKNKHKLNRSICEKKQRKHTNQTNTTHSTNQFVKKCNHPITRSILGKTTTHQIQTINLQQK